jgi:hypothetical protein
LNERLFAVRAHHITAVSAKNAGFDEHLFDVVEREFDALEQF